MITPDDIVYKKFTTTTMRKGYDMNEVDDFLDEILAELRVLYAHFPEIFHTELPSLLDKPLNEVERKTTTPDETGTTIVSTPMEKVKKTKRTPPPRL